MRNGRRETITETNQTGKVKWFNPSRIEEGTGRELKNYGFIIRSEGGADVFVHGEAVHESSYPLTEGDEVVFDVAAGKRGPKAVNVVLARLAR